MISPVHVVATDAHEGPVYVPAEDALYFTSVPRRNGSHPVVAVRRLALDGRRFPLEPERVETVREDANVANGMALDRDGRLVVCEQGTLARPAAVTRDGRPLADRWNGLPLNSPNDVVVRSDGSIWFTDPSYGWLQGFRPKPMLGDYVYRLDPDSGALEVVADGFDKPNGLCFSPDERTLRGEHCPRERQHHVELLRFARWCSVAFPARVDHPRREARRLQAEDLDRRGVDLPRRRGARGARGTRDRRVQGHPPRLRRGAAHAGAVAGPEGGEGLRGLLVLGPPLTGSSSGSTWASCSGASRGTSTRPHPRRGDPGRSSGRPRRLSPPGRREGSPDASVRPRRACPRRRAGRRRPRRWCRATSATTSRTRGCASTPRAGAPRPRRVVH